jgi:uncharacterized protein (DUF427 family)/DNA-binding CsgD family transcriptional regulator
MSMGLVCQQRPPALGAAGRFLVPAPLPGRLLYAEPVRRRMCVRFGGGWIADSHDVILLHEPGCSPVAYFPLAAVTEGVLQPTEYTTRHADLGPTSWYAAQAGHHRRPRAAWRHTDLPDYASELDGRVAFASRAVDAIYEEAPSPAASLPAATSALPSLVDPLTSREQEVLGLLAQGRANRDIAGELVVTIDTVKRHVSHILAKLGAVNRTEAAVRARELNLIE